MRAIFKKWQMMNWPSPVRIINVTLNNCLFCNVLLPLRDSWQWQFSTLRCSIRNLLCLISKIFNFCTWCVWYNLFEVTASLAMKTVTRFGILLTGFLFIQSLDQCCMKHPNWGSATFYIFSAWHCSTSCICCTILYASMASKINEFLKNTLQSLIVGI